MQLSRKLQRVGEARLWRHAAGDIGRWAWLARPGPDLQLRGLRAVARAKWLSERRVVFRHGLRCALLPVVSQLGIDVGTLLGGVVVTESVFSIGGIGQDSVQAIDQGNLPVIIGFVLVAALFVVVASIVVDFCYTLADPRIRLT
jgi:ABC-type dipeptide/oligopeptide/nickel transport system permease component